MSVKGKVYKTVVRSAMMYESSVLPKNKLEGQGESIQDGCTGLETNARPLARGELNSVRASGLSDLTSPVGEWEFYGNLPTTS